MKNYRTWLFILLIPFFAALAHDVYVNFYLDEENRQKLENLDLEATSYQVSDAGYIAVKYTPSLYEQAKTSVPEEYWTRWVDPVLRSYTFLVAIIPAAVFLCILVIVRLVQLIRMNVFSRQRTGGGNDAGMSRSAKRALGQDKESTFKYKRR